MVGRSRETQVGLVPLQSPNDQMAETRSVSTMLESTLSTLGKMHEIWGWPLEDIGRIVAKQENRIRG